MSEVKQKFVLLPFDLECVPNNNQLFDKAGKRKPLPDGRNTIQLSVCELSGVSVVPELNINPNVEDWKKIPTYLNYTAKCWQTDKILVPAFAERLPAFGPAFTRAMNQVCSKVGMHVILVAYNGNAWDFKILARQAREANLKFYSAVYTFDPMSLIRKHVNGSDPECKDKSWKLGKIYKRVFKEDIKNAHTAKADAVALGRLVVWLILKMGFKTYDDFAAYLIREKPVGFSTDTFKDSLVTTMPNPIKEPESEDSGDEEEDDVPIDPAKEFKELFKRTIEQMKQIDQEVTFDDPELDQMFGAFKALRVSKNSII